MSNVTTVVRWATKGWYQFCYIVQSFPVNLIVFSLALAGQLVWKQLSWVVARSRKSKISKSQSCCCSSTPLEIRFYCKNSFPRKSRFSFSSNSRLSLEKCWQIKLRFAKDSSGMSKIYRHFRKNFEGNWIKAETFSQALQGPCVRASLSFGSILKISKLSFSAAGAFPPSNKVRQRRLWKTIFQFLLLVETIAEKLCCC